MRICYRLARRMQQAHNQKPQLFLRKSINDEPILARFSQCILDYFNADSQARVRLDHSLAENRYILTLASNETDSSAVLLTHANQCPIRRLSPTEKRQIDDYVGYRESGVATSAIIESADGRILLTRRARTLRSFPGVWVGPGGYVDPGEGSLNTIAREIHEETGLDLSLIENETSVLNLWESAFPPVPEPSALPKRHDIVIYYHIRLAASSMELRDLRISPDEVDTVCWVPNRAARSIIDSGCSKKDAEESLEALSWDEDQQKLIPASILLADLISNDNVSAGTKFALRRMLEKRDSDS